MPEHVLDFPHPNISLDQKKKKNVDTSIGLLQSFRQIIEKKSMGVLILIDMQGILG